MKTRAVAVRSRLVLAAILVPAALFAGFGSTETYLPAVGRVPGKNGAQFYTTIWATNLTSARQTFTFELLKTGQSNPSPASFEDSLEPGQTKVYENVVESKLGLSDALGAARILSSGEIFVSERIYNQSPGDDLGNTEGLFFAGVPKGFSISAGQSASIQGIDQGGSENFRYNFALIETGGGNPTVNVQVFDGSGTMLGQKAYPLLPWEHVQPSVDDVVPGIATTNARITATVTGGSGSVLLAGAQVANESQDSSGFEMTFRDSLLGGGGGTAGVTSLNGLTGALTLKPGNGISITPSGSQISIAYTGGGSSGLTAVTHDASLAGDGTGTSPLSVANGQVVRSLNGLHDSLTLAAGSNVTITPNGSTLTIASTGGGGGGLTLPFSGSANTGNPAFWVQNSGGLAIRGTGMTSTGYGVFGDSSSSFGVLGESTSNDGVHGYSSSGIGVKGESGGGTGVYGTSSNGDGVLGQVNSNAHAGVSGTNSAGGYGVYGGGGSGWGVYGTINGGFGATAGVNLGAGDGVYAESASSSGIYATGNPAGFFHGKGSSDGIVVENDNPSGTVANFYGNVTVNGTVTTAGAGAVILDDPRDPSKQSLTHAFVGSSEMKNIYDGVVTLGPSGTAAVELPDWFEHLNADFRYQLTALGTPQAGLFVSREIAGNMFTIAGGVPGARVSWQVTGVRKDPWAQAHPVAVVTPKTALRQPTRPER